MKMLGWSSAYTSPYPESALTEARKQAIIDCVRHRHYSFTYNDLCFLSYCCPVFKDKTVSVPTRDEWNEILSKAYADIPIPKRLLPSDAIKRAPINEILYEQKNDEPKGSETND